MQYIKYIVIFQYYNIFKIPIWYAVFLICEWLLGRDTKHMNIIEWWSML